MGSGFLPAVSPGNKIGVLTGEEDLIYPGCLVVIYSCWWGELVSFLTISENKYISTSHFISKYFQLHSNVYKYISSRALQ